MHDAIPLYLTEEHPCSYIEGRSARTLFVDPRWHLDSQHGEALQRRGFRRSGRHFYRPSCNACQRCIAVRIPVERFVPDRSQRRNLRANADLRVIARPARFTREHYACYERYLLTRHADGDMADDVSRDSYTRFLLAPWGGATRLLELRDGQRLIGVAVSDRCPDSLSAVYTFFDPAAAARAPGTFAVLAQIREAQTLGLSYLYLGYWIEASRKMTYKQRFRPIEAWDGKRWQEFGRGQPIATQVPFPVPRMPDSVA